MSAPEIRRNTKHPDSSKLDPGFCLCGYTASQYWRLKPPFQERVRHFCFAVGSPAVCRFCRMAASAAGIRGQRRNAATKRKRNGASDRGRPAQQDEVCACADPARAGDAGSCLHESDGTCSCRPPRSRLILPNIQAESTHIAARRNIASVLLCSFLPSACRRQAKGEQSADCRPQPALPVGSSAGRARRKRVLPSPRPPPTNIRALQFPHSTVQ